MHRTLPAVALASAALLAGGATAAAIPTAKITAGGVGKVKLGDLHTTLRASGLVGPIGPGCELAENTRAARLRTPFKGSVQYTQSNPRRVQSITIRAGNARARGVGIGSTIAQIQARFPSAIVDHSTDEVFLLTLVRIPKTGPGDRFQFGVSTETGRTEVIGVPFIAFCE